MNNELILICSHCGNRTPHVIKTQTSSREEVFDINNEPLGEIENYYYLTECKTCNGICLFSDWEASDNPGDLQKASLLYPAPRALGEAIPKEIREKFGIKAGDKLLASYNNKKQIIFEKLDQSL